MSDVQNVANVDFYSFAFAAMVALMLLMFVVFTGLTYFAVKQVMRIRSAPCAFNVKDLQPGQILLAESAFKGHIVRVRAVQVDASAWGGGFIETSENEILRIPAATLVLVQ